MKKTIKRLQKNLRPHLTKATKHTKKTTQKIKSLYRRNPLRFTAASAGIFLVLLIASLFVKNPVDTAEPQPQPTLEVQTFTIGQDQLQTTLFASVKNLSSITLVAQTAGPLSYLGATEGQSVYTGQLIAKQSTAYNTGSAADIGVSLAKKSLELADITLQNTSDSVTKTRDLADRNRDNTEELRKITEDTLNNSQNLLATTNLVIDKINSDIAAASDAATIQGLRQQLASYQSIKAQTESAIKNAQYSIDKDNPPTALADIGKDQVYLATELQLKSAQLSKDIAQLNLKMSQVQAATSRVSAPFAGTIEKIYLRPGEYAAPGTPIAKITGNGDLCLIADLSADLAARVNQAARLKVTTNTTTLEIPITHLTTSPVNGQLYQLIAEIPSEHRQQFQEGKSVEIAVPLHANPSLSTAITTIPLDSVFVTNQDRFVYRLEDGRAVKASIQTGQIIANQIEVTSGLQIGAIIITDRRVKENQQVTALQ